MKPKVNLQEIEAKLEKFIYELETEDRLVRVGLKEKAETVEIYKKYQELFTRGILVEFKKQIAQNPNARTREILERVYFTLVSSFIGQSMASITDSIKTYFSISRVKVMGEDLAYFELQPRISKEPIFDKRELYDDAASNVITKINPKQEKLFKEELELIKNLGFADYLAYYSVSKKMDYANFSKIIGKIKKETDKTWEKVIWKVSEEILGKPFGNIRACHLVYLRSMSAFDNFYPREKVVATFLEFVKGMGFSDIVAKIQIDDKDRPKKNPRAVCYWPKPPQEVHLVIKPIGGEQDYEAMFHEGGHALHGAAVDKNLPFSFKLLARSGALTETFAFILEDLVFDEAWLSTCLNVSSYSAQRIQKQAYFVNLMMLRRYLGKFSFEYEMFSKNAISRGPRLYAKNLQEMTGFITKKINWLTDMDSGFYSADYLRAWIAAAQIKDYLKRKFGQKWFTNVRAGKFLRSLFARGVTDEVEEMVKRLGYKPFDFSYLVRDYRLILN